MLRSLRHEIVRRRVHAVVDLLALRAGRLVGPYEIIRQMQRQRIVRILAGGFVDARQMVAIEHDRHRLVELVELIEEVLRLRIGDARALRIRVDGRHFVGAEGIGAVGRGGLELVVGIPVVVRHMVLHRDDLDELVRIGRADVLQRALIRGLVGHVRGTVDLVPMLDDVVALQRVEMRESELLVVRRARIHRRLIRVEGDGVLRSPPHLVDRRRPMLPRYQLLVRAGQRRVEIRHAQARQSHILQVRGAATVSGRQHQTAGRAGFDGTDLRNGVLVELHTGYARGV